MKLLRSSCTESLYAASLASAMYYQVLVIFLNNKIAQNLMSFLGFYGKQGLVLGEECSFSSGRQDLIL